MLRRKTGMQQTANNQCVRNHTLVARIQISFSPLEKAFMTMSLFLTALPDRRCNTDHQPRDTGTE